MAETANRRLYRIVRPAHVAAIAHLDPEMGNGPGQPRDAQCRRPHARAERPGADVGRRPNQADSWMLHRFFSVALFRHRRGKAKSWRTLILNAPPHNLRSFQ